MSRGSNLDIHAKRPGSLMGMAEVGEALGVPRSTIQRWMANGTLPRPVDGLKATPVWSAADIARFQERRVAAKELATAS